MSSSRTSRTSRWRRISAGELAFQFVNYFFFLLFMFMCLYPFYYLFLVSVSDPLAVSNGKVILLPSGFTLENFVEVAQLRGIGSALLVSSSRAVLGTILTVFTSCLFAYTMTKHDLPGRKFMYRATVLTLYTSAGLIPWYLTMRLYGLNNNYLLYLLPYAVSPFSMILIKTYIESLPPSLEESALMDGAGYNRIFVAIIVPLSKPILAAVAVFSAVLQWNSWQDNFFLVTNQRLQTVQLLLINFLKDAEAIASSRNRMQLASQKRLDPLAIKTTIAIITAIPIILVYPLMQKYFLKGILLGAVKG